jgi:hypothetical protein
LSTRTLPPVTSNECNTISHWLVRRQSYKLTAIFNAAHATEEAGDHPLAWSCCSSIRKPRRPKVDEPPPSCTKGRPAGTARHPPQAPWRRRAATAQEAQIGPCSPSRRHHCAGPRARRHRGRMPRACAFHTAARRAPPPPARGRRPDDRSPLHIAARGSPHPFGDEARRHHGKGRR